MNKKIEKESKDIEKLSEEYFSVENKLRDICVTALVNLLKAMGVNKYNMAVNHAMVSMQDGATITEILIDDNGDIEILDDYNDSFTVDDLDGKLLYYIYNEIYEAELRKEKE